MTGIPCTKLKFYFPVKITGNREIRITELDFQSYIVLLKYITNGNDRLTNEFYEGVLRTVCHPEDYSKNFSKIDKALILLQLRALSVSSIVQIKTKNELLVTYDLQNILKTLQDFDPGQKTITVGEAEIKICAPSVLWFSEADDVLYYSISEIAIEGEKIEFPNVETRKQAIDSLPSTVMNEIFDYIEGVQSIQEACSVVPRDDDLQIEAVELNVYDNSLFKIINMLYDVSLKNIFEMQYQFLTKMKCSLSDLYNLSFSEAQVMFAILKEDLKKQKDEHDAAQAANQNGGLNLPVRPLAS